MGLFKKTEPKQETVEKSWSKVMQNMEQATKKTWLAVPRVSGDGIIYEETKEILDCSPVDFALAVKRLYPEADMIQIASTIEQSSNTAEEKRRAMEDILATALSKSPYRQQFWPTSWK